MTSWPPVSLLDLALSTDVCVKCVVRSALHIHTHVWESELEWISHQSHLRWMLSFTRTDETTAFTYLSMFRTELLQKTAKLSRFILRAVWKECCHPSISFSGSLMVSEWLDVSETRWRPDKRFVFICSHSRLV